MSPNQFTKAKGREWDRGDADLIVYDGRLTSTGGELTGMKEAELQSKVIKLKTDNEILQITLKHLQEEINMKSETARR